MATKPKIKTLTNSSVDVLNAIRNSASTQYRDYVPLATKDADSIREIGAVIMDMPQLQNEFLSALVNRIGRVILTSKLYSNPWSVFKKGLLEFGETIEEIFVNIAKPFQFDPEVAEEKVFAREIPDVRSAFHVMNYQKYYKATIQNEQLRQAFLSWDGITDLIAKIVDAMYTGANYDEFLTMKYMLARHILNGQLTPVEIPPVDVADADVMKLIVGTIKGVSNSYEFASSDHNIAGVFNHTPKDNQYLIVNAEFDAFMDVEVLASAFNMDKATFMGHRILVDSFGKLDTARLNILFADDNTYSPLTNEEIAALDAVPAVLVDSDFFMIFDNMMNFTELYNGEGLYWNYWYHTWKTFSISPFAQTAVFVPTPPSVDSITVVPTSLTMFTGDSTTLSVDVETLGFAPKTVEYTSSDEHKATVSANGIVMAKEPGNATITITSTYNPTVKATVGVTVQKRN